MTVPLQTTRPGTLAADDWLAVFQAAPVGMARVSPAGRFELVNPALCEMFGRTAEQMLALDIFDITFPEDLDSSRKAMNSMANNKLAVFRVEKRYRHLDGHTVWALLNVVPVVTADNVEHFQAFFIDITERKRMEEELRHAAGHDPLTGVANRAFFFEILKLALHRAERTKTTLAVTFTDLDGFKELNDAHGHKTGDAALVEVAQRFERGMRAGDLVSRFADGGSRPGREPLGFCSCSHNLS